MFFEFLSGTYGMKLRPIFFLNYEHICKFGVKDRNKIRVARNFFTLEILFLKKIVNFPYIECPKLEVILILYKEITKF